MRRYTGDFTITLGNTTWKPNGVYFDSPNPDGAEHFGNDQHALSQLQKDTLPKTASSRPIELKTGALSAHCPGGHHAARAGCLQRNRPPVPSVRLSCRLSCDRFGEQPLWRYVMA
jgi:hypothetical protein